MSIGSLNRVVYLAGWHELHKDRTHRSCTQANEVRMNEEKVSREGRKKKGWDSPITECVVVTAYVVQVGGVIYLSPILSYSVTIT